MFDPTEAGLIVALVRIVAFGISGLLAYFGYRLFFTVPSESSSGGKIESPGLTITLSHIAPGSFFAICSAGIIIASFSYPISVTDQGSMGSTANINPTNIQQQLAEVIHNTSSPTTTPSFSAISARQAHQAKALHQLACIRDKYVFKPDELTAIDQARTGLMAHLWQEKWGEFKSFETWALENRGKPPVTAAELMYTTKDPRCIN